MVHDTCVYRERAMVKLHVRCSAMLKQNPTAFRNVISLQKLHLILFVKRCLKNFGLEASGLDFWFRLYWLFSCYLDVDDHQNWLTSIILQTLQVDYKKFSPHFQIFVSCQWNSRRYSYLHRLKRGLYGNAVFKTVLLRNSIAHSLSQHSAVFVRSCS